MCDEYDEMEAVLQELVEEAMITGGAVWVFGPDGSTELLQGATLLPHRHRR